MLEPREMVALVDLTSLTGEETETDIAALCEQASTPAGPVAAVCVYGRWVAAAAERLDGTGIPVAAVANFPEGDLDADRAVLETEQAVADGAREIDVVLPWRAFLEGDRAGALDVVERTREACPVTLKVILESGALEDPAVIGSAARDALAVGADFIKTSTGKREPAATLPAAAVMLEAVRDHGSGGFKASGGIRTAGQAAEYLELADAIFGPEWVSPSTFRFGASSLLADLLGRAGLSPAEPSERGY
jgi:deoxyribose-phosphate aldolase